MEYYPDEEANFLMVLRPGICMDFLFFPAVALDGMIHLPRRKGMAVRHAFYFLPLPSDTAIFGSDKPPSELWKRSSGV